MAAVSSAALSASSQAVAPAGVTLTDVELRTLKRALALLTAARAAATSPDPNVAVAGKRRVSSAVGYLVGFLDGKGLIATVNPGFAAISQSQGQPDPDAALDNLQKAIQGVLDPTRSTPVGIVIGAVVYAIGAYLLST